MIIPEFTEYLKSKDSKIAIKCLTCLNTLSAVLNVEKVGRQNVYFFIDANGYGLRVPKYLTDEAEQFLRRRKQNGKVYQDAHVYEVTRADGSTSCMLVREYASSKHTEYSKWIKNKSTNRYINDPVKIAMLLCE